jgi:thioredoxin reductase
MLGLIGRYTRWLHTQWPAGTVEKLPVVNDDGSTNVRGVYVVGDLTGIPLLKFSADSGARAVQTIIADKSFTKLDAKADADLHDLVIIGGGVSGYGSVWPSKSEYGSA